jgi:hypothetical protein
MMYARNLVKNYLDLQHVPYQHHIHSTAFTAQQLAAAERVPGTMVAKTVVVKADDQFVMAVLPGTAKVDTAALKDALNARELQLATEREFHELFPDSDVAKCRISASPGPARSPDGKQILFSTNQKLYLKNADGVEEQVADSSGRCGMHSFLPMADGSPMHRTRQGPGKSTCHPFWVLTASGRCQVQEGKSPSGARTARNCFT